MQTRLEEVISDHLPQSDTPLSNAGPYEHIKQIRNCSPLEHLTRHQWYIYKEEQLH